MAREIADSVTALSTKRFFDDLEAAAPNLEARMLVTDLKEKWHHSKERMAGIERVRAALEASIGKIEKWYTNNPVKLDLLADLKSLGFFTWFSDVISQEENDTLETVFGGLIGEEEVCPPNADKLGPILYWLCTKGYIELLKEKCSQMSVEPLESAYKKGPQEVTKLAESVIEAIYSNHNVHNVNSQH